MFESLRSLSDRQILANIDSIAAQDRKLTLRLLEHLHEVERRKLHLKLGYGSMFDYCTRCLRFSEPAAARRIRTARCLARFPRLHDLLESGDVNLTTASMVAKLLKPENADVIIGRIKGKSRRAVERVVAEYQPSAMFPPDRVRTVAVPVVKTAHIPPATVAGDSEKPPRIETLSNGCVAASATMTQPEAWHFERRKRIEFTAHENLIETLERVRSLASHRLPMSAPLEQLIRFLADYFIQREDPRARQERRKTQRKVGAAEPTQSAASRRAIPARLRDEVFTRDGGRCTYIAHDGTRCDSDCVLQIDHIVPVARRGVASADNLRLLCARHNRLEAERLMGRSFPSG